MSAAGGRVLASLLLCVESKCLHRWYAGLLPYTDPPYAARLREGCTGTPCTHHLRHQGGLLTHWVTQIFARHVRAEWLRNTDVLFPGSTWNRRNVNIIIEREVQWNYIVFAADTENIYNVKEITLRLGHM